jgi:hypothetical protein
VWSFGIVVFPPFFDGHLRLFQTHPAYLQNSDHASLCASSARLVAVVSLSSSTTLIGLTHPHPSAGALILAQNFRPLPQITGFGPRIEANG